MEQLINLNFRIEKKQKLESISDFGHSLRRLAAQAYRNLDLLSIDSLVMDHFVEGMGNHDLKRYVQLLNKPKTLDPIEFEAFEGSIDQLRKPHFSDEIRVHSYTIAEKENDSSLKPENKMRQIIFKELKK